MRLSSRQRQLLSVLAAVLAVVLWWWTQHGGPDTAPDAGSETSDGAPSAAYDQEAGDAGGLPVVTVDELPPEAADTLELIDAGGPYPYPERDGSTFFNREGLLPDRETGWYREYTVPTPGEDDRGARRIVSGSAEDYYWTADHYDSFAVIDR